MPRITAQPIALVEQLASIAGQIAENRRDNLRYAKEAADLLRTVPEQEQVALAKAAGIGGRSTTFKIRSNR